MDPMTTVNSANSAITSRRSTACSREAARCRAERRPRLSQLGAPATSRAPRGPRAAPRGRWAMAMRDHPGGVQLVRGPEQRHAVPGRDPMITAGADHHVAAVRGQHGDRGQRPVELAQRASARGDGPGGGEPLGGQPDLLDAGAQAGFRDRRGGQPGHVEHRDRDPGQRPAHGRVAELDHDPHVGAQFPGQQGRLQRAEIVFLGADHRLRPGQPGLGQGLGRPRTARDVRDAPADEVAGQPQVRVIVDDDGGHAGGVEQLDDPQAHAVQAADDHVPAPARVRPSHPVQGGMGRCQEG